MATGVDTGLYHTDESSLTESEQKLAALVPDKDTCVPVLERIDADFARIS